MELTDTHAQSAAGTPASPAAPERTERITNAPAYLCGRPLGEILIELGHLAPEKLEAARWARS